MQRHGYHGKRHDGLIQEHDFHLLAGDDMPIMMEENAYRIAEKVMAIGRIVIWQGGIMLEMLKAIFSTKEHQSHNIKLFKSLSVRMSLM